MDIRSTRGAPRTRDHPRQSATSGRIARWDTTVTVTPSTRLFRTGNHMIAEGAVRAGCRVFAGYPITPASGINLRMFDMLQSRGDLAVAAPDEISALAYCVGASMRGYKALTATSGPGWSLMVETVQYALMTETPVVIAMVQRLGPATGSATQGGQGDVLFTEFCTSGGYTIPVLCPSSASECYTLAMTAMNWAEMLRSPVVLLTDKEVAMTCDTIDPARLVEPPVVDRPLAAADDAGWRTYGIANLADVPTFAPVGGPRKVMATGSAHNMSGDLKKNDPETLQVLEHLERKIAARRDDLVVLDADLRNGADTLVLSYGVTARAMKTAVAAGRARGLQVSAINVMSLFPVPEQALRQASAGVRRVVVAEENMHGQYRMVVRHLFPGAELVGVNAIGRMITPSEILDALA